MAGSLRILVGLLALTVSLCALGPPSIGTRQATTAERESQPPAAGVSRAARTGNHLREQYGRLPLSFERNEGQSDPRVEFIARGVGYTMFLTRGADAVLHLHGPQTELSAGVRLTLVGGDVGARARGRNELPGKVNYLLTSDQKQWRTGIATFESVVYDDIYPGIDVMYYGNQRELEYDFVVRAGADPRAIAIAVAGADALSIDARGDLVISVGGRELRQRKPVVYQEIAGGREEIEGRYRIDPDDRVRFHIGNYDTSRPLVIDPVLVYSTYLGGAISRQGIDNARDVAIDAQGNAYVTGSTVSTDFPVTTGSFNRSTSVYDNSVFVTKLNAAGTALVYSTLLGGSESETGNSIAVDPAGNAYLTGSTQSADFPVTVGAFDTSLNAPGNDTDAFVTKLDAAGSTLVYSTFLGGNETPLPAGTEQGAAIAVDAQGHAYVTGITGRDFPTTDGAFDRIADDRHNGFVAKFDPAGATLVYSTFLGGSDLDHLRDIAVDASGSAYVTGLTQSIDFPTTPGAFDTENAGGGFISKLHPAGTSLLYSTFLDGATIYGIAVDPSGSAYVTGAAVARLPTTPGAFDDTLNGPQDAFVSKISADGAMLVYSTFVGGDTANAIAVHTGGSVYVAGSDVSGDVPVTSGAFDTSLSGSSDAFVAALDSLGATLVYATYLGGIELDDAASVAVDSGGAAVVVGSSSSNSFPTTAGAFDTSLGDRDGFVTKISFDGSALIYSTFLGGTLVLGGTDQGVAVAVDAGGSAYVAGSTQSIDFPTTPGAFNRTAGPLSTGTFVFVTKLDPTGAIPIYSTYVGRGEAHGIAVDSGGHAYVTGSTNGVGFPTTPGAFDERVSHRDAFVTKLNPSGTGLIYSTVLGGWQREIGNAIAVDAHGNAYVAGFTETSFSFKSENFPTTPGAFDEFDFSTSSAHVPNSFVTKFSADGSALIYSTLLGGSGPDFARGIAVDGAGMAYVTGSTASTDFPTTPGAVDIDGGEGAEAFVTKLNAEGRALVYSTFLGGSDQDHGWSIAVDSAARAYVTGFTNSDDFPTTATALDPGRKGGYDAFVSQLDAAGTTLAHSTYLGGGGDDFAYGIALDSGGGAHLTGVTFSPDFPTTANAFDRVLDGTADAWLARLEPAGAGLTFSTYFGGSGDEIGLGVAVDQHDDVYVAGWTFSSDFPITPDAYDSTLNVSIDAFVVRITGGDPHALTLTPARAAKIAGQLHCVRAALQDAAGNPLPGVVLRVVVHGPHSAAARVTTRADGTVPFCYLGTRVGIDEITFYADTDDDGVHDFGEVTRTAVTFYSADAPLLFISAAGPTISVGDVNCVSATVRDKFANPIPVTTIRFSVTGAANTSGSATGNLDGLGTFCYSNVLVPGQDTIVVYADLDGDSTRDADEPGASAAKQWVVPASSPGCGSVEGSLEMVANGASTFLVISLRQSHGAMPAGTLTFSNTVGLRLEATEFFSLVIVGQIAIVYGQGPLDGAETVPFVVGFGFGSPQVGLRMMWPDYVAQPDKSAGGSASGGIVVAGCG